MISYAWNFPHTVLEVDMEFGGLYILAHTPLWVIALVLMVLLHVIPFVGRDYLEGLPYQVSYSAHVGEGGLFIVVLIAATILQRQGTMIPVWLASIPLHIILAVAVIALGALASIATLKSRSGKLVDVYHDLVIAPLFLYLAVTLLPIIYANGTSVEFLTTVCLVVVWVVLVMFDITFHRMNQRAWLMDKGVVFKR